MNIGSVSGLAPYATGGSYAASKAALIMLTRALSLEAGPFGITVNLHMPRFHSASAAILRQAAGKPKKPIGRAGVLDDIAPPSPISHRKLGAM